MSYLVHHVPGRVRIKVPTIRYSPGGVPMIRDLLESLPGVEKVVCNPVTGSVVVYYDQNAIDPESLVQVLRNQGHLNATQINSGEQSFDDFGAKAGRFMAKALLNVALDVAFKNTPLSVLTIFI
uniref:Cation transporter n=1 Tax=Desulfacinum infernum TaxID=35837 RepID=A0A832EDB8_9BACT